MRASSARTPASVSKAVSATSRAVTIGLPRSMSVRVGAACFREMTPPVGVVKSRHVYFFAAGGCVHEATVTDVQRYMRGFPAFLREEQEVAALQLAARDRARHAAQLVGAVRQIHATAPVAVLHETTTIDPGGVIAAVTVRFADHGQREFRRAVSGRLGWVLSWSVTASCQGAQNRY